MVSVSRFEVTLCESAFERGLTRFCDRLPHQIWIEIARNQFFIVSKLGIKQL